MPRQIRCRCGRQMQVRHSEWIYIAAGLGVVGLLLNIVVIIYLYTRLNEVESNLAGRLESRQPIRGDAPGSNATASTNPPRSPAAGLKNLPPPASAGSAETNLPDTRVSVKNREGSTVQAVKSSPTIDDSSAKEAGEGNPPDPSPAIARAPDTADTERLDEKPLGKPLEEAELWKEFFRAIEDRFKPPTEEEKKLHARKHPGIESRAVFEAPALARLLFLARSGPLPTLTAAHLLDPDPRVQGHAIRLLLGQPAPLATESNTIRSILHASGKNVLKNPRGQELLDRFQAGERSLLPGETNTAFDESWSTAITLAEGSIPGWPDLDTLAELLDGLDRRGLDLVLAVDTTRSMEAGLMDLKKACSWLLPALQWGAGNLRIGLLTYKDKVITSHPLSEKPSDDLLPLILELKAVGGGDVPEGIDSALRSTLELGRFEWRPLAARRILVIGDAPTKYSNLAAIESLVAACHQQAGFIIHMIGVRPKETPEVPFFARIAARGGGRSPTCPPGNLGEELLSVTLGSEKTALPEDLAGLLRTVFSAIP